MAPPAEHHGRQPGSLRRLFKSRRPPPSYSEATSKFNAVSPDSASQVVIRSEGPNSTSDSHVIQSQGPTFSTTDLPVRSTPASDDLVPPVTVSDSGLVTPNSPPRAADGDCAPTGVAKQPSLNPINVLQKDLWSRAAKTMDASTRQKWQSFEFTVGISAGTQPVSDILDAARERARSQSSKVWKQRWLSLVKSVSNFKSLVDAGVQFDPTGYATLVWSILSFGLQAAVNNSEIEEELAGSCQYVQAVIDEYASYEARYLDSALNERHALESCIVDVYGAIITYAAEMNYYIHYRSDRVNKAVQGFPESTFVRMKAAIEEKRTQARSIISEIRDELSESHLRDIELKLDAILATADVLSEVKRFADEQEREQLLSWISDMQVDTIHVTQRDKAEADDRQNPGAWILTHNQFVQWRAADHTAAIWLSSGVGTGKTVLTSTVIEDSRENRLGPLAYFYCSGSLANNATDMTGENILRCLLRQFATYSEVTLSKVASQWELLKPQGLRTMTRLEVLKLLGEIIEDDQTLEATIIIDGLDELSTNALHVLLDSLGTLLGAGQGILKVFASSRWVQRIEDMFSLCFRIDDLLSETRDDMQIYIESAVQAQAKWRRTLESGLVDDIQRTLLERANGMFRYIELAIKYIFDATTNRIREKLEDLPYPASGEAVLQPMYEKLYADLEEQAPVEKLLAHRVLQWLLYQLQPLTDEALLKAVRLGSNDAIASKLKKADFGVDEVKAACHHLVVHNSKTGRFEFGHVSVVEFIHWKKPLALGDVEAHSTLATACIVYLLHEGPHKSQISEFDKDVPRVELSKRLYGAVGTLNNYSVFAWAWHWHETTRRTLSPDSRGIFEQFWDHETCLQACIEVADCFDPPGWSSKWWESIADLEEHWKFDAVRDKWICIAKVLAAPGCTQLQQRWLLACMQDFPHEVDSMLRAKLIDHNATTFVQGVKLALACGSTCVLELVNSNHFHFGELHAGGVSLLHHAANLHNVRSTRKCLELFPDAINLVSFGALKLAYKSTPLVIALQSRASHDSNTSDLVRPFLSRPELDVDIPDHQGRHVLHLALEASLDHEAVANLLRRDHRAIFRRDADGRSGLTIARTRADHGNASLLYQTMTAYDYPARDLHEAARIGDIEALSEILVLYNAKGSIAQPDLLRALLLAVENQRMESMRMILKSPHVDVNDQDQDGFSALMIATISGNDYAVRKLRLQGASLTLETSFGRNVLFYAIAGKRLAILKALLGTISQSVVDINHQDSKTGRTLLHYACGDIKRGSMDWYRATGEDFVREILTHEPDIGIRDRDGRTARDIAEEEGRYETVGLLGSAGSRPTSTQPQQFWPSLKLWAAFKKFVEPIPGNSTQEFSDAFSFYSFESCDELMSRHLLF